MLEVALNTYSGNVCLFISGCICLMLMYHIVITTVLFDAVNVFSPVIPVSLGVSILKRSMRLYSPFYSSDIIISSPLGLRTLLGVEGDSQRDFDFLSSIELLVLDQTDVFLMQNWEHVLVRA